MSTVGTSPYALMILLVVLPTINAPLKASTCTDVAVLSRAISISYVETGYVLSKEYSPFDQPLADIVIVAVVGLFALPLIS